MQTENASLSKISVHDDYTINRIFEVTGQQVEDEWLHDEQLAKWLSAPDLEPGQHGEILRLQEQFGELKKVNRKILAIDEVNKEKTIDKVLGKSDAEIRLDFLTGN